MSKIHKRSQNPHPVSHKSRDKDGAPAGREVIAEVETVLSHCAGFQSGCPVNLIVTSASGGCGPERLKPPFLRRLHRHE